MVPFAVQTKEMEQGQGTWVLEVDAVGNRLLLADEDGSLHWHDIADCKLIKVKTPDTPVAVIQVVPNQQQVIVSGNVPNRAMRRNGGESRMGTKW